MSILWRVKEQIEKRLHDANFLANQQWELVIYGSTLSSLSCNEHSDLDMTLILHEPHNHTQVLRDVQDILVEVDHYDQFQSLLLPSGPLLQFHDYESGVDLDISVNKILEIINSRLILAYAQLDRRFANLAIVLKMWNKSQFKDKMTRLNSYTLNLMLIAFM
jgi:DNA polymerase sigma